MLSLAALALAAATATGPSSLASNPAANPASGPASSLVSTASWWERITVTIAGDGKPQACVYQSSLRGGLKSGCEVEGASAASSSGGAHDQYTKITFERRFSPGPSLPTESELHPGDTLVAGQVLAIAIDGAGAVQGCSVVAKAGGKAPDYGCDEIVAEKFEASARTAGAEPRRGYLTVLVYGHSEQVV